MNYTPVIIIGSGRSGTNMLRDIITSIPDFESWDCDEINPIWRYGNKDFKTDELLPNMASKSIKLYVNKRFSQLHKKTKAKFIVEKTCANSLRLAYVYSVFPDAKYIIINRDGRDVVPSAMKRWVSSFDFKYTLKKLRFVPLVDLWFYIWKFGKNRIKRMLLREENLSFWGPIYEGIKEDTENLSLMEVCAKQWQHCAENTIRDRELVPVSNIYDVKYEDFVCNPFEEMKRLFVFFKLDLNESQIHDLIKNVSKKSVGSHKKIFTKEEQEKLNTMLQSTLNKLNYN